MDSKESILPAYVQGCRIGQPGLESIPGLLERFTKTGSVPVFFETGTESRFLVNPDPDSDSGIMWKKMNTNETISNFYIQNVGPQFPSPLKFIRKGFT
jgi:hypothetical protein